MMENYKGDGEDRAGSSVQKKCWHMSHLVAQCTNHVGWRSIPLCPRSVLAVYCNLPVIVPLTTVNNVEEEATITV